MVARPQAEAAAAGRFRVTQRGDPEMSLNLKNVAIALLGVLAYKNRDKIGELLTGKSSADPNGGGGLSDALNDILDRFKNSGAGDQVDSWVGTGPNKTLDRNHVEQAIDPDTLSALSAQTGLSREELLDRLTKDLPDAVDKLTPNGQMPTGDLSRLIGDLQASGRA
jgi:uncharacterized protein YidB (DUF937 family)